jgi:hypothetical protein
VKDLCHRIKMCPKTVALDALTRTGSLTFIRDLNH